MTVTIYDVAKEAKVSMATVSRVLNGNPNVKPETRKRVKEVIERLNYRPNAVARGLASKRTTTVGVIIPDISSLYYSALVRGLDDVAKMYQYHTIITNTDFDQHAERDALFNFMSKQVDGIIYLGGILNEDTLNDIEKASIPVVLCGTSENDDKFASVNIDVEAAMDTVIQNFIDKGHTKCAFIKAYYSEQLMQHFENGIRRTFERNNLEFKDDWIIDGFSKYEEAPEIYNILKEKDLDIVISMNDAIAVGIIQAAQEDGLNVPEDMEVLSCANTRLVHMSRPTVSSVRTPLYDIGAVGMRLLTKYMNNEEVTEPNVILPHAIDYRGSTK